MFLNGDSLFYVNFSIIFLQLLNSHLCSLALCLVPQETHKLIEGGLQDSRFWNCDLKAEMSQETDLQQTSPTLFSFLNDAFFNKKE